jgi:hypothetical protein
MTMVKGVILPLAWFGFLALVLVWTMAHPRRDYRFSTRVKIEMDKPGMAVCHSTPDLPFSFLPITF